MIQIQVNQPLEQLEDTNSTFIYYYFSNIYLINKAPNAIKLTKLHHIDPHE